MTLVWKWCILLHIFGLPIIASLDTGGPPHIWLSDYSHYDHHIRPVEYNGFRYATEVKTEFFNKTGPLNYTVHGDYINAVVFSCESELPVVWDAANNEQFQRKGPKFSQTRSSVFNPTMTHPLNKIFRSDFSFRLDGRNTTLMATCVTTTSREWNATFYLKVWYDEELEHCDNPEDDDEGPLRPTDPPPGTKITTHENVSKGATFSLTTFTSLFEGDSGIEGYLFCCTPSSSKQSPIVASFECGGVLGCEKRALWKAFQDSEKKFKTALEVTESPTEAEESYHCDTTLFEVTPAVIAFCKGDGVNVFQEYVTVFEDNIAEESVYSFVPVETVSNMGTNRKMLLRLTRRSTLYQRRKAEEDDELGREFYTDPNALSSMFTSILQKRHGSNPLDEILPVEEIAEGEEVQVVCVYLSYFYAGGGRLRLNWRNGTKTLIPWDNIDGLDIRLRFDVKEFHLISEEVDKVAHRVIGKVVKVHPDMESVDCFAPELKGVGWDKRSIPFNPIRAAIPPKFVGPEVEVIELRLNETGVGFKCEVSQFPVGDISIFRDDDMRIDNWAAVSVKTDTSRASFPRFTVKKTVTFEMVTEEAFAEYRCVAENHAGSAVKLIRVVPTKA